MEHAPHDLLDLECRVLCGVLSNQYTHENFRIEVLTRKNEFEKTYKTIQVVSSVFCIAGIWSVGEQLSVETHSATFLDESYLEVDYFEGTVGESCFNSGEISKNFSY